MIIANYFGQGWVALTTLIMTPVYLKYLGPENFGIVGFYLVLQQIFFILESMINIPLSRSMALTSAGSDGGGEQGGARILRTYEILTCILTVIITALFFYTAPLITEHWLVVSAAGVLENTGAVQLFGLAIGLKFFESIYLAVLMGSGRQVLLNKYRILYVSLKAIFTIFIFEYHKVGTVEFFASQITISAFFVVALSVASYRAMGWSIRRVARPQKKDFRSTLSFGGGMLGITAISAVMMQSERLILSGVVSLEVFNSYVMIATLAGSLLRLVAPIAQAVYPQMCVAWQNGDLARLTSLFHVTADLVVIATASVSAVLLLNLKLVLVTWLGEGAVNGVPDRVGQLLVLAYFVNALSWAPYRLRLAAAKVSLIIKISFALAIIWLPTFYWLTVKYHVVGAGIGFFCYQLTGFFVSARFVFRGVLPSERGSWLIKDVLFPTGAAMSVVWICKQWVDEPASLVCILVYLLTLGFIAVLSTTLTTRTGRRFISKLFKSGSVTLMPN